MNQYVDKALQHLTGKSNIDYVSLEELDRLVSEHPYFAVAQVLLSKKLKAAQADSFLPQVQKTALYFTNPYWLHYQLMNDLPSIRFTEEETEATIPDDEEDEDTLHLEVTESGIIRQSVEELETTEIAAEPTLREENTNAKNLTEEETEPLLESKFADNEPVIEEPPIKTEYTLDSSLQKEQILNEPIQEDLADTYKSEEDNEPHKNLAALDHPPVPKNFKYLSDAPISLEDTFTLRPEESEFLDTPSTGFDQLPGEENPQDEQNNVLINYVQEPDVSKETHYSNHPLIDDAEDAGKEYTAPVSYSENVINEAVEVIPDPFHPEPEELLEELEQQKAEEEIQPSTSQFEQSTAEQTITLPVHEEDSQIIDEFVEAQHHEAGNEENVKDTPVLDRAHVAPLPQLTGEPVIPIEPYYTVDYFASQGIKFTVDKYPQDKLGKQLKSFTQWLKHMKKLGPEDALPTEEDTQMESNIQRIAAFSNTPRDIVTEAMAQVLEKQGKTQQAVEVYNKLSFLNPRKSAYFADKISNLKGI